MPLWGFFIKMDVTATQLICNVFTKTISHWNSDIVGLGNFPTSKMPFCIYEGTACGHCFVNVQ